MDDNKYFFHALVIEILYTVCYKVDIIYGHRLGFILATLEDVDQTGSLNLFVLNAPFLYPLKTSENFSCLCSMSVPFENVRKQEVWSMLTRLFLLIILGECCISVPLKASEKRRFSERK